MAITKEFRMATFLSAAFQDMFSDRPLLDGNVESSEVGECLALQDFMLAAGNAETLSDFAPAAVAAELRRQHPWLNEINLPRIPKNLPQAKKGKVGKMFVDAVMHVHGDSVEVTQPGPKSLMFGVH